MNPSDPSAKLRPIDWLPAIGAGLAVLLGLLATSRDFGIAWDEAYTIRRERLLAEWFDRVAHPPFPGARGLAFGKPMLDHYWPFSRAEPDGHPPFYALLGLAGWRASHSWLSPLTAYRLGPMVLTAITSAVVYAHMMRRRGRAAGLLAAALLVLMPRSLAHAHYAHYDMPMSCLWILAQVAFVASLRSKLAIVPFGVCLGLAAGTKFTGLFAVVGPAAWVFLVEIVPGIARPKERATAKPGLRALLWGVTIAAVTLYAIQPAWWLAPLEGPGRFVASNLSRDRTKPLPTYYFGRLYMFSLPWHNTLVYTAITTPLTALALGACGIAGCISRRRSAPWLLIWPLSWGVLMVVRALPNAPGHDAIRLILPSVASLAVLAGLGASFLAEWTRRTWVGPLVVALALGECLVESARVYPYTDSYYNAAFGGLPAAERRGFELTYYWEAAGPEFLAWVRAESRRPLALNIGMPAEIQVLLREWGDLPADVPLVLLGEACDRPDYVQQRRRGFFRPHDRWLEAHGAPRFAIRRQGVDLLRVFPHGQWLEAVRASPPPRSDVEPPEP